MISSASIITWITMIAVLLGLIGASVYAYMFYGDPTTKELDDHEIPNNADNEDNEEDDEDIQQSSKRSSVNVDDLELIDDKSFNITEGQTLKDISKDAITYEDFKRLITQEDFLVKFTAAIKQCLEMKRRKYIKMLRKAQKDVETFSKAPTNDDFITAAINKTRNEQLTYVQDIIGRVKKIYSKISQRLKLCCLEDTRERLHSALYNKDLGLESIVGRHEIKNFVAVRLYTFAQNPKVFFKSFQNIVLMANPGAGKTRLASTLAHVFSSSGILVEDNPIITTKADVISAYVNETINKTRSFMLNTLETLVFFDEAYDFVPPKSILGEGMHRDHGHEAITQIVNDMDKMVGLHIIIASGYEQQMKERFLGANEGMMRRFPYQIVLDSYSAKDLSAILIDSLRSTNPQLEWNSDIDNYLYTLVHQTYTNDPSIFSNQAGDIINLSSEISHAIYGSKVIWPSNWQSSILNGFNHYLDYKGKKVVENSI